jgi:hypothetical protein
MIEYVEKFIMFWIVWKVAAVKFFVNSSRFTNQTSTIPALLPTHFIIFL